MLIVLLFLLTANFCYSEGNYYATTVKNVVRYDVTFIGNADTFLVVHEQSKIVNEHTGAQILNNNTPDFGNMRFSVFDKTSGTVLYRKGFSPLFQEWLLTNEAKTKRRSFYQGLFFPKPPNDVLLTIDNRNKQGEWENIFTDTIAFSDSWIKTESPTNYPIDTLLYSGNSSEKIDLVILSEGYTMPELKKFVVDARRMADTLMSSPPFNQFTNRFNIYAVSVPSAESGADQPDLNYFCNTVFNASWYTFESTRYLTTSDMKPIYDVAECITWDHLTVLVNSERYGGGGFYNFLSICSSNNERSPFVFIHEFGHSFAGLADEYFFTANELEEAVYPLNIEPWEPNITTLTRFDQKWKSMIDLSIPVPTPRDSIYSGKTGLFEGGGYVEKGVYSPSLTCWMKEHKAHKFCQVCQDAIRQTIVNQSK
jgi:hypothetical protein